MTQNLGRYKCEANNSRFRGRPRWKDQHTANRPQSIKKDNRNRRQNDKLKDTFAMSL